MTAFDPQSFAAVLALLGVVLLVASLLSGVIERSGVPQVGVFLAIGAVIGPFGLRLLNVDLDSSALRVVATLSLALVLFTEALTLNFKEVRQHGGLALLILGPGTALVTAVIAFAGVGLLGLPVAQATMLGAALASTDPVLLRSLLRWRGLPADTRLALRLESGLNDVVLLPVIFIAIALALPTDGEPVAIGQMLLQLFLLGPGAGVAVGLLAVSTLSLIRNRVGVRRDYESLYSIGVCFVAFGAAEAMHASGFLAAFAAGATIAALDVEMCDCFLEYGETTAELTMLFTFVLLGTSLIWSGFGVVSLPVIAFVLIALAARPLALLGSLSRTHMDGRSKRLLAWFGPRGLSTLLLILLPVFENVPESERMFQVCTLVMLVSVVLHGGSVMALERRRPQTEVELKVATGTHSGTTITIPELAQRREKGQSAILLDARTARTYDPDGLTAEGAIRIDPENVVEEVREKDLPKGALIAAFCT